MRTTLAIAFLAAGILASGARADGLPVFDVDVGPDGVATASVRYVALPAPRSTLLARVRLSDGRIERFRSLRGRFTIPAVAYDGTPDGLAADGRTLVLIQPRAGFPRRATRLAVVDTASLKLRREILLRGDFSFDAVSPDGRWLYLIRYLSADDPNAYEVRVFDLERGRLLRRPIVDPAESGEEMRGAPVTRATSPDGRWAYTLYDGAGGHPFVHALDTVGRAARCVDLDELAGRNDLGALRLSLEGAILSVVARGRRALALIDTRTFRVDAPAPAPALVPGAETGPPWLAIGVVVALGGAVAGGALARRRRAGEAASRLRSP